MSFPAHVFRVLIASPSDVVEERNAAVEAIQDWNNRNSADRQVVLLPLRFETHAVPTYGERPQEIINRQVVDYCDLLVGVFWTRIGTPTGTAEAGTVEEIERVAAAGKPVMLYFSSAKANPDDIEPTQLAALKEFKKKKLENALVDGYSSTAEFRDKLLRHLDVTVKNLASAGLSPEDDGAHPAIGIELHFADPDTGGDAGTELKLSTANMVIEDFDSIPDYTEQPSYTPSQAIGLGDALASPRFTLFHPNKDYYRQRATAVVLTAFFKPVRFWLKNRGKIGVRDLHVKLSIDAGDTAIVVHSKATLPKGEPPTNTGSFLGLAGHQSSPNAVLERASSSWSTTMDVAALQPQRELSPSSDIVIGAKKSCTVTITATVFGDILSEPIIRLLTIRLEVADLAVKYQDVIGQQKDSGA